MFKKFPEELLKQVLNNAGLVQHDVYIAKLVASPVEVLIVCGVLLAKGFQ
jgi:hypothetical protein